MAGGAYRHHQQQEPTLLASAATYACTPLASAAAGANPIGISSHVRLHSIGISSSRSQPYWHQQPRTPALHWHQQPTLLASQQQDTHTPVQQRRSVTSVQQCSSKSQSTFSTHQHHLSHHYPLLNLLFPLTIDHLSLSLSKIAMLCLPQLLKTGLEGTLSRK